MTTASIASILHTLLRYAELGYRIFPCAPGRKKPITDHGLLDATIDQEQIEQWWTEHPNGNVAIRSDGLLVVDVDGADNVWLRDEPDKLADLDAAALSLTPRGGQHYFFRQPAGRAWRNTAGRLAQRVDTRANGGYVLVAPSVVDGNPYQWTEGRELSVPPQRLPQPPAWLTDLLDALAGPNATALQVGASNGLISVSPCENVIPEGRRNDAMAHLAGAMRRVGMAQAEISAALRQVNTDRCTPPLPMNEVERIATSIARYQPDAISVAPVENHWRQEGRPPTQLKPLSMRELMSKHQTLRAPVICGLLRRGETMNVIAPPKTGKSWFILAQAMCVATGRRWLDTFETVAGNVLIVDNELHLETLAQRIPQVAECLKIGMKEIAETMNVQTMRGQLHDIHSLRRYFQSVEPRRFALVVLDAFYRFMPGDMDENDNAKMANIYNHVDALADRLDCSFVLVHHATKGNQSAKAVTDVGAGAGSQSRATDTHLVMRPHAEAGAFVLEAAVRSWPPVEPMALRWLFPLWKPAPDLDPAQLRSERPGRRKGAQKREQPNIPAWPVERFVEVFISEQQKTKAEIRDAAKDEPGLSGRRVSDLIDIAESKGLIHRWSVGRAHRALYATVPQSGAEESHP